VRIVAVLRLLWPGTAGLYVYHLYLAPGDRDDAKFAPFVGRLARTFEQLSVEEGIRDARLGCDS
jgi:hypothetical protein